MTRLPDKRMAFLDKDIDEILGNDIPLLPTQRGPFVRDALTMVVEEGISASHRAKLLAVLQVALSTPETALSQSELCEAFDSMVRLAAGNNPSTIAQQAIVVASTLAMRFGKAAKAPSKETRASLLKLSSDSRNEAIQKTAKSLSALTAPQTSSQITAAKKGMSSSVAGDIVKSIKTVTADLERDWYQDPWLWPELQWLATNQEIVVDRLGGRQCSWTQPLDVPKKGGGSRPALVMSPTDRVAYQVLADELSLAIAADLPKWVYGWRLERSDAKKATYANNAEEWRQFHAHRAAHLETFSHVLRVDVQSYFASIDTELLLGQLGRRYRRPGALLRLEAYFDEWIERANGHGLPQRSVASSLLAHVPLRPLDIFLEHYQRRASAPFASLRWMDDIYLFSDSEATLRSASAELELLLDQQRLQLNPQKTLLIDSSQSEKEELIDLSGDDTGDPEDFNAENAAITELLEGGEGIQESQLRYLSKIIAHASNASSQQLKQFFSDSVVLDSWSYAADSLARMLRSSGLWKEKVGWYVSHIDSHIAPQDWTVAAWGRMFPDDGGQQNAEMKPVTQAYERLFASTIQTTLVPIASHLLGVWTRDAAKDTLFGYLSGKTQQATAFENRAIALALRELGEDKRTVSKSVSLEDDVTLNRFLADS